MSKSTPGPWVADNGEDGPNGRIYGPNGHGSLAEVYGDSAEAEANQFLIAAAPEMYEGLQAARAILQACGEWGSPIIAPQVKIIADAIRKAEGAE